MRTIELQYDPNLKQQQAHALKSKYRGFCGGWGNGKTTWGCVEFFLRLMEYPGTNSIIARKTRPELKSTTWDMWVNGDTTQDTGWHGVPKEVIKKYNQSDLYMELRNGSKIHGLPLDDPKKIENYNLGLFWIDQAEEVEEDIFLKFHGRLRQHKTPREGLLTFNPNGHNWLWKRFITTKRSKDFKRAYKCIEASPFDNPNLPEDYLEQFAHLPDHWYQRFVEGSHDVFVGQIFPDFNEQIHVIAPFKIPSDWERWMCVDPGLRNEGAAVWCARDLDGWVYCYREIVEAGQPVDWWAASIYDAEAEADYGGPEEEMDERLIGPEARQRAQTDGKSVLDLYEECGLDFSLADRDPASRISRITEFLRAEPRHLAPPSDDDGPERNPGLRIFSTCPKIIEYLPQYRWRPQRTNYTEEQPAEAPRRKDDHPIDCLGHILVALDGELPEVEDHSQNLDPEQRELDEHFERELADANERAPLSGLPHRALTSAIAGEED